jgi:hypothetical protein
MVSEGGAVYFREIALAPGVTELAIKQAWWRESITSTAFLDKYPLVKMISLFEFEKIEDISAVTTSQPLSDFRITNNTEILNAFNTDLAPVLGRYALANTIEPPPVEVEAVTGSGDGKTGSSKNSDLNVATGALGWGLLALLI